MSEGYSIQTVMSLLVSCLPVIAFFVILMRKAYHQEALVCLMGICLLSFFNDVLLSIPAVKQQCGEFILNIHMVLNFALIMVICRTLIYQPHWRRMVPTIILSAASIFSTYILLSGLNQHHPGLQFFIAALVLLASLLLLYQLMRYQQLQILTHPLFYLGVAFFFYYFQFILIEVGGKIFFEQTSDIDYYSWLLMLISKTISYLFFLFAALMAPSAPSLVRSSPMARPY